MTDSSDERPAPGGPMIGISPLRLLLGLTIGLASGMMSPTAISEVILRVALPIGRLWLDALTMTVVPLVFGLLVTGIATTSRQAAAGGTTLKAMIWFAVILTTASLAGAGTTEVLLHIWPETQDNLPTHMAAGAMPNIPSASAWYADIIPANPVRAAADMSIIPLVTFALFLGFALARLPHRSAVALLAPIQALVDAMLIIVGWVLWVGPLGIAALAFGAGAHMGIGALGTLAHYVLIVSGACLFATLLAYGWVLLGSRIPLYRFIKAALPAQAVALGTQSSLASLPVMVEVTDALGLSRSKSRIILPLAVSLFRAASVAANVAVALYLAHLHQIPTGPGAIFLLALLAVPVSLAAVGLPAQISFFATIAPLCLAFGIPVNALPLLLAIEAIPDLFRTIGNVTNDLAVLCMAGSGPDPSHENSGRPN